jgi:integrase
MTTKRKQIIKPIKDLTDLAIVKKRLERQPVLHDLFCLGINVGLRIGDLIKLKPENYSNGRLQSHAEKTGKVFDIELNATAKAIVEKRIALGKPFLFFSSSNRADDTTHISRQALSKALAAINEEFSLGLGTHSMRKTYGYHLYQKTNNLGLVQGLLQHSSSSETLRYIGIDQDVKDYHTTNFEL